MSGFGDVMNCINNEPESDLTLLLEGSEIRSLSSDIVLDPDTDEELSSSEWEETFVLEEAEECLEEETWSCEISSRSWSVSSAIENSSSI